MAELQQLQAPRIELEQQLPLQTWNRDVQYANFMLYNPENCVQDIVHRSDEILFDETPLHIGMKYNGEEIGIFIYPVRLSFNQEALNLVKSSNITPLLRSEFREVFASFSTSPSMATQPRAELETASAARHDR